MVDVLQVGDLSQNVLRFLQAVSRLIREDCRKLALRAHEGLKPLGPSGTMLSSSLPATACDGSLAIVLRQIPHLQDYSPKPQTFHPYTTIPKGIYRIATTLPKAAYVSLLQYCFPMLHISHSKRTCAAQNSALFWCAKKSRYTIFSQILGL